MGAPGNTGGVEPRRWRPRWLSLRRVGLAALALAIGSTATVAVARPWAFAALREGVPDPVWPAEGDYAHHDEPHRPLPVAGRQLIATEEYLADFERSNSDAVLIVDDGRIVYGRYADGHGPDTAFNSFSMVKSLVGVLVLMAVSDGLIADLDVTVGELWPAAADTELAPVALGDVLDMRSGISFERPPGAVGDVATDKADQLREVSPFGRLARLHIDGPDAVIHDVRLIDADRGAFSYQQLNTAVLGRILEEQHGRPLDEILARELVEPAGAGEFHWRRHPGDGRITAYCCLYATTEWWAIVMGHIAANGGEDPLLTPHWHNYLLGRDLTDDERHTGQYRSQIRHDILDREGEVLQGPFLYFSGLDGQVVYLLPDEGLIVVRFGDGQQLLHSTLYRISDFESP